MDIIALSTLRKYWGRNPNAEQALRAWFHTTREQDWGSPPDVKATYPKASILKGGRVVFNIRGNHYRLVAHIDYERKVVRVRFIGTHSEYDRINAQEV